MELCSAGVDIVQYAVLAGLAFEHDLANAFNLHP
jgi:hypothetical protein